MIKKVTKQLSYNAQVAFSRRVEKKLVIFESDDWGSIRMSSKRAFKNLEDKGLPLSTSPYMKFDHLERSDDLTNLFEVLSGFRDQCGKSPIFTANFIVGNPDFKRIEDSNFTTFFWESFLETYLRQESSAKNFTIIQNGINQGLFDPQFHGREHVNSLAWLQLLRQNDPFSIAAFKEQVIGYPLQRGKQGMFNLSAALDLEEFEYKEHIERYLIEGVREFVNAFSKPPESFIAPNYIWGKITEKFLADQRFKSIQSGLFQFMPKGNKKRKTLHFGGAKNSFKQFYSVRNVFFEPSNNPNFDWVDDALMRINIAFTWKVPAVICTHRLNYLSGLDQYNGARNLTLLRRLLKEIMKNWRDVRFIRSIDQYN